MNLIDLISIAPIASIIAAGILMLLFDLVKLYVPKLIIGAGSIAVSIFLAYGGLHYNGRTANELVFFDGLSFIFYVIILLGLVLSLLLNDGQLKHQRVRQTIDVDILMFFTAAGAMAMVSAANFIILFVGFEIMSIGVYALSALGRQEKASAEAALKYFILGSFSSAFLLYGIALIYGSTGTFDIAAVNPNIVPLFYFGMALIVFGFAFKVSLAPFHFWTPDVYQGAPSSITTFMASVVKAAAFGSFLRVMIVVFGDLAESWQPAFWMLSVTSMTVGNLLALRQTSVKRMLAYSSIAHAGYATIGFAVLGHAAAMQAIIFYIFAYVIMTIGSFGVVLMVTGGRDYQYSGDHIAAFNGIGWKYPLVGLSMTIFLLALAGVPPLVGFFAKFYIFAAALEAGYYWLVLIAAINSVISLYYYLRVVVALYFKEAESETVELPSYSLLGAKLAVLCSLVAVCYFGVFNDGFQAIAAEVVRNIG